MLNKFNLKHKISDEYKSDIHGIDSKEFDEDFSDIEGQYEIIVGNFREGLVSDELPFGHEWLFSFYKSFNRVAQEIKVRRYVAFHLVDSPYHWLEFEINNDKLVFSGKDIDEPLFSEQFITEPRTEFFPSRIFKDKYDEIGCEFAFVIDTKDFVQEVVESSLNLVEDIRNINANLLHSKILKDFMYSILLTKKIWNL